MTKLKFYHIFILIALLAFALRFYDLGYKAFNWDEAVHAWITRSLIETGQYSYSPVYHGPLQFYLGAIMFSLFGISEFAARVLPAAAGILIILLLYLLRGAIGKKAVLVSSFLIAISPFFVYYSRFFREDIYLALFTLATFVFGLLYFERKEQRYLLLSAVAFGLSLSTKENTAITFAIFAAFLVYLLAEKRSYKPVYQNARPAVLFVFVALLTAAAFYTAFFIKPEDFARSIYSGIDYWVGKHQNPNLGGPWHYYFTRMWLYEPAVLIFGLLGIAAYIRHKNALYRFAAYWSLASLIIYSIVQEKMPWLTLNVLLPFAVLAGLYVSERLNFRKLNYTLGIFVVFVALSLIAGIRANYIQPTNAVEPLIYAQTEQSVKDALSLIDSNLQKSEELQILHRQGEGLSSPLYLYLWDYRNKTFLGEDVQRADGKVVLLISLNETIREVMKAEYTEHKFYTWGYYNHDSNPAKFLSPAFYLYRIDKEPVSEQGIFYVYVRSGLRGNGT